MYLLLFINQSIYLSIRRGNNSSLLGIDCFLLCVPLQNAVASALQLDYSVVDDGEAQSTIRVEKCKSVTDAHSAQSMKREAAVTQM